MKKTILLSALLSFVVLGGQKVGAEPIVADSEASATLTAGELQFDPEFSPEGIVFEEVRLDGKAHNDIPIKTEKEENSISTTINDGRGEGTWTLNVKLGDGTYAENEMTIKFDGSTLSDVASSITSVNEWTPSKKVTIVPTLDFTEDAKPGENITTTIIWELDTAATLSEN